MEAKKKLISRNKTNARKWKHQKGGSLYSAGNVTESLYHNTSKVESLGTPWHKYDFTQSEEWANAHGYLPDERGHRDDRVKKETHPSRGSWNKSGTRFYLSEKGLQDPNHTLFGLADGGLDPQATLYYKDSIVLPEITVTTKDNYIHNTYDNIKLIPQKQSGGYIVKKGDTLAQIALDNKTTVELLKKYNKLISDNIKIGQNLIIPSNDKTIGNIENYGWSHPTQRGNYDKNQLKKTIDPGAGFNVGSYISNGFNYYFDVETDPKTNLSTKYDRAFFHRHIGFPRDYALMPTTDIRFSGDFNEDGTPKFPNAEYVGIDGPTKGFIKEGIKRGYIKTDKDGLWTPKKETWYSHRWTKGTSHLGSYAVRENNGSGIYDVFDTYDFNQAISNRLPGYLMEIRDTIHGPNARPELYDKNFSTEKAEQRKIERLKNNNWLNSLTNWFE